MDYYALFGHQGIGMPGPITGIGGRARGDRWGRAGRRPPDRQWRGGAGALSTGGAGEPGGSGGIQITAQMNITSSSVSRSKMGFGR
jgi:hypothetical protein